LTENAPHAREEIMSRRAKRKQVARALLEARDEAGLLEWARSHRNAAKVLVTLLFDPDRLMRWRAIEGLGVVAAWIAETDLETVREIIRFVFWSMNDESGGIIWDGPEAIAEVLVKVPELRAEYAHRLPHFLDEEPFERGTAWANARLVQQDPGLFRHGVAELVPYLHDSDPGVRAHVAQALRVLVPERYDELTAHLQGDGASVAVYDFSSGEVVEGTIRDMLALPEREAPREHACL